MDITLITNGASIEAYNSTKTKTELFDVEVSEIVEEVGIGELLDEIEIGPTVDYFTDDAILDHIGKERAAEYFGLVEPE
jgi:hypothetical protein